MDVLLAVARSTVVDATVAVLVTPPLNGLACPASGPEPSPAASATTDHPVSGRVCPDHDEGTQRPVTQPGRARESARAIVHDAGDPRIDAHLRALGLAPDPAESAAATPPAKPTVSPEVEALRARLADLEGALAASSRRFRWLVAALAAALVIAATLAVLLVGQAS